MDGDKSHGEIRERGSIMKQMAEMKKKIQLVEGERKAVFEDCENEKAENKEKIKRLKDEIKDLQVWLTGKPWAVLISEIISLPCRTNCKSLATRARPS